MLYFSLLFLVGVLIGLNISLGWMLFYLWLVWWGLHFTAEKGTIVHTEGGDIWSESIWKTWLPTPFRLFCDCGGIPLMFGSITWFLVKFS